MEQESLLARLRRVGMPFLAAGLVCFAAFTAWNDKKPSSTGTKKPSGLSELNNAVFEIQSKLLYATAKKAKSIAGLSVSDLSDTSLRQFAESILEQNPYLPAATTDREYSTLRVLILVDTLGSSTLKHDLCSRISPTDDVDAGESFTQGYVTRLCSKESPASSNTLSIEELSTVESDLGWFGSVLLSTRHPDSEQRNHFLGLAEEQANKTFEKSTLVLGSLTLTFALGVSLLLYFLYSMRKGRINFSFAATSLPPTLALEIFCLYLSLMLFLPKLIAKIPFPPSVNTILIGNIVGISSVLFLLEWPSLWGYRFRDTRRQVGLFIASSRQFLRDFFLGPIGYLGFLPILFLVMFFYSLVLMAFHIETEQGAHPVIPLLAQNKDFKVFLLVGFLAVIVAPITEEIMFRGALYSWLRAHLRPLPAVVFSGFVFALVHPQGLLGLVPLTAIGCLLAFLREWRGSLVSPMMAHATVNAATLSIAWLLFGK